jgi:hypothetical protein
MIWTFLKKPIVILIGAAILLLLGAWLVNALTDGAVAKQLARLRGNEAQATLESGQDAVRTVGTQGKKEDALTKENEDAIRNAPGATETVPAAVDNAGRASLCKRAAYRQHKDCL